MSPDTYILDVRVLKGRQTSWALLVSLSLKSCVLTTIKYEKIRAQK
jgi:hypothetical protein